MVYPESGYIQHAGIFKIWGIFKTLSHIYDEAFIVFTAIIISTNDNNFCKACSVEINILRKFLQS